MQNKTYVETFDAGPGGWYAFLSNREGLKPLEIRDSMAISHSPWWLDYNHAPPGAGYLHILFALYTKGSRAFNELVMESAGHNRFVEGGYPTDFTNAKLSFRLKGELETRGANLVLLMQGTVGDLTSGWALTGDPLAVTPEWTEQTLITTPNAEAWTCLGSRHDRARSYGKIELSTILRDVNCNLMLILFPLQIVPMGLLEGNPHILRAGRDYPVWQSRLPDGYVLLDEIRIDFP